MPELRTNTVGWFNLYLQNQTGISGALKGISGLGNMKVYSELLVFYHC